MAQKSQLKAGALLSYMEIGLNILLGIVYTPVVLRILGKAEYGLYSTVSSTILTMSILSLGLNSGYIRYFSMYKKNNDMESIYKLNGLFISIFTVIGIIIITCGLLLTANVELIFDEGLTKSEYATARILMVLFTISLAISFPAQVFAHIITANERFVIFRTLGMIKTVAGPLVALPLLFMGYGSIGMVSATLFVAIVIDVIYFYYVIKVLKYKFYFRDFEKGIFKSIFVFTGFIALNLIAEQMNHNLDKILISRYMGTEPTAVYAIGYTLYMYYTSFANAISGVFTPRVHNTVNATDNDEKERTNRLTELFVRVGRIQYIILALLTLGIIFFGYEFIMVWAGSGYEQSYYVVMLLIIVSIVPNTQNIAMYVQRAINKHKFSGVMYVIMAFINLVLSILLIPPFGIVGATVGTVISQIVGNILIMNIYYNKKCNIKIFDYWKNIISMSKGLLIPISFGIVIKMYFDVSTVPMMLLGIAVFSCVYAGSMWLFALNKYEKNLILSPIKNALKKQ